VFSWQVDDIYMTLNRLGVEPLLADPDGNVLSLTQR
jgi:hypothetical protein